MERILDLIYDAAGRQDLWPAALAGIADLTGSEGGVLFGQSVAAQQVYFDFNGRLSQECNQVYQDRHMQNLWSMAMEDKPVGRVVVSDDVVPLRELERSGFYDEVLRPQGIGHNAMIALAARDDFRVAFNICRSRNRGEFEASDQKTIEMLAPHLRRSVTLGFRLTGYHALRNAAFDVIDQLADGVVVMGPRAHVLFANQTSCSLEAEGTLRLKPSMATWSSPHSRRLGDLVRSALAGGAGGTMSLPAVDGTRLLTIIIVGLRSQEVAMLGGAFIRNAACAAFVIDPPRRARASSHQLMNAYGLTKAEARVAVAASSGGTTSEAATMLGLSANTVKTHLRRVFAKTDTRGQAELAALLATIGVVKSPGEAS
ncbi:helix-turn-helix transcriptional regulator [Bradyrhizobium glycinis]|uniref:helix-turn-helix transcriptional regulator n=1 Tax=Bradyrhizobium glycinis TaxID=2751812 RepID=UPI0018D7D127|nr:LuxR C-terminal-related transcriptional regulator [Bradyrhizobium glycinis]MBH5369543.1 helix-turn-helix transcriptional regulator [Bradyrhizobium glycinis]